MGDEYVRVLESGIRSRLPGLLCTLLSRASAAQIDQMFNRRQWSADGSTELEVATIKEQLHDLASISREAAVCHVTNKLKVVAWIVATVGMIPRGFMTHFVNQLTEWLYQSSQATCVENSFRLLEFVDAFSL